MKPITSTRWTGVSALCLLAACAADTPETWNVSTRDFATPAGAGSGEPFLSTAGDEVYLSWLEADGGQGHDLRFARLDGEAWTEPVTIHSSERFFVNWADFPSIVATTDGTLWAHWLERGEAGGYDYGIRVVRSDDAGATWSEPWKPHEDDTPTEHGFVSMLPLDSGDSGGSGAGGVGLVWLDGRQFVEGPDGAEATREMTLRFRTVDGSGVAGPETLLDARVCDCCQTDAAMTVDGPVVVYRDRSPAEIRDIYVTRLREGVWTDEMPIYPDGWEIAGCPVNGPAVAADSADVAVAWFAAPGDEARVKVAFSDDSGATFGPPVVVDDGDPSGRVDILYLGKGEALVGWLERTGGDGAEVRVRLVRPDGKTSPSRTVTTSSSERASGFPRMVRMPGGDVLIAWTDVVEPEGHVRVTRLSLPVAEP